MTIKLLTPEIEELLRKHQMLWINDGNAWDKGFVQGIEHMITANGENLANVYEKSNYKDDKQVTFK